MRKLIMWNLITIDGFFEGLKSWEIDWHEYFWDDELEKYSLEQLKSADLLLFGRITYQGMADYWSSATGNFADIMNNIPKIVFSNTLKKVNWKNTSLIKDNIVKEVIKLKNHPGKNIFIFGSANLSSTLMQYDLIDEYRLCINPIILGCGNPLFKPIPYKLKMKLLDTKPLKSGSIILSYEPEKKIKHLVDV